MLQQEHQQDCQDHSVRKGQSLNKAVGKYEYPHVINEIDPTIQYTKMNSKWIRELIIGAKIIRLLKENIWEKIHDTSLGNDSLDMISKA